MEIPSTETDATTMSSQSREQLTTVIDTLNQQFNHQAPQQQQQGDKVKKVKSISQQRTK